MMTTLQDQAQRIQDAFAGATPIKNEFGLTTGWNQPNKNNSVEIPVFDQATGLYKSSKTGAVWTGKVQQANGVMATAQNGKLLPTDAYGNVLPVITPTTTIKQPEIASAASNLLTQQNTNAAAKSFTDYLNEAKTINAQSKEQLVKDQAAVDPTATIDRLNTGAANTTAALNENNRSYVTNQQGVLGKVSAENTAADQTTTDRLAKLKSDLDAQNAQYEKSAQDVAAQAWDKAQQQLKLYQLGSGTPTSGSGDLTNRYLRSYASINVPLQQELAARRYSQVGALDQQQQQADAARYANLMAQYGAEGALNTDVANRVGTTAQYTGQLDANTALQVQSLRQATAGMSRAQAISYLQQLQIPFDVGQHVLAGDIANLAGIQQVDLASKWYNANTTYDPSRIPVSGVPVQAVPGRNYTPDPNKPNFQDSLIPVGNGLYQDPATGATYTIANGVVQPSGSSTGTATRSYTPAQATQTITAPASAYAPASAAELGNTSYPGQYIPAPPANTGYDTIPARDYMNA